MLPTEKKPKVFISYVRENSEEVEKLAQFLQERGISIWLDRKDIMPGSDWKNAIRAAIEDGDFFIACFSKEYHERIKTHMNEELTLAVEELRLRPSEQTWFIPVLFSKCMVPDRSIGGGRNLRDIQWVELYGDWQKGANDIASVILASYTDNKIAHQIRAKYYDRVNAIDYSLEHDDGLGPSGWHEADVVLVGSSRTSKTPISMYLAVLGYKVANYPIVPEIPIPPELFKLDPKKVIGLMIDPARLTTFRKQRQRSMGGFYSSYSDPKAVNKELEAAQEVFKLGGFRVIDITDKAIESIADEIIGLLEGSAD
ncbi:kinase/pyrophosphorylase [Chloroflexota bacterium]